MRRKRLKNVKGKVGAELAEIDWNKVLDLEKRFPDTDKSELVRWGIRVLHAQTFTTFKEIDK